jgi:hypothetical protein
VSDAQGGVDPRARGDYHSPSHRQGQAFRPPAQLVVFIADAPVKINAPDKCGASALRYSAVFHDIGLITQSYRRKSHHLPSLRVAGAVASKGYPYSVTAFPTINIQGDSSVPLQVKAAAFTDSYSAINGLGIAAGYHRLSHTARTTSSSPSNTPLHSLARSPLKGPLSGGPAVTLPNIATSTPDLDPYSAQHGFWWAHVGWMMVKPRRKPGVADVSDLSKNPVVRRQHTCYVYLIIIIGFITWSPPS